MAVAVWSGSTAFSVGDIRRASAQQPSGLFFRCTTAGNSASAEPSWPNNVGDTVTDGTCVWTAIASAFEELAKINPSAIIELFELRLDSALHGSNDIYRWHAGTNADVTGNIVFGGQTYERIPVKADGFEYTNTGTLPRPTLTVSNLGSEITAILLVVNQTTKGNDLGGAEVRRIRTLKKYLDGESAADPNVQFPQERWFIDRKASETRDVVSFELASKFDLAGQSIPKRQLIANVCQWKYRSSECSYAGTNYFDVNGNSVTTEAEDVCGKRVASCKLRFGENNELPFGSFPGAGLTK
jgi:lambda family phage minor tail protein L